MTVFVQIAMPFPYYIMEAYEFPLYNECNVDLLQLDWPIIHVNIYFFHEEPAFIQIHDNLATVPV